MSQGYFGIPKKPPVYTKYSSPASQAVNSFMAATSPPLNTSNSFGSFMHSASQSNTLGNQPMSQSLSNNRNTFNYSGAGNTLQGSINPSNQGISAS